MVKIVLYRKVTFIRCLVSVMVSVALIVQISKSNDHFENWKTSEVSAITNGTKILAGSNSSDNIESNSHDGSIRNSSLLTGVTISSTSARYGVKIPLPVMVSSLYKSGTTSIHEYFKCGGVPSVHKQGRKGGDIGACIFRNINHSDKQSPFHRCGLRVNEDEPYQIFSDVSALWLKGCYDPSVFDLESIYSRLGDQNLTVILTVRDSYKWFDSVDRFRFRNWSLLPFLKNCTNLWPDQNKTSEGRYPMSNEDVRQFYLWHQRNVRDFASKHPSLTFIEIDLEEDNEKIGAVLEEKVGIQASCWGQANVNRKNPAVKDGR